ncbi:MAG: 4Fe-4S dicluster domain-containing protein [Pseudomonadota bacterium]
MKALQDLARQLLEAGDVKVVIGYEEGRRGVRAAFVTDPAEVGRLVFDARCVQNLASYLSPRRPHIKKLGRPAVVVKGCDARAVAGLIRESQLAREDVVLIGVTCGGVYAHPHETGPLTAENVAPRCVGCLARAPNLRDHLVGEPAQAPPAGEGLDAQVDAILALPVAERLAFWKRELEKCVRCHACRQACPLCVCERCITDQTQPRWIDSSAHARGNWAWNLTRAQHLAGRCAGCAACELACPEGIPLMLLNRYMARIAEQTFDYRVGDDPDVPAPIGTFRKDDPQEFIV